MKVYNLPEHTNLYDKRYNGVQFWILDQNGLFISGGPGARVMVMNNCYTVNISTNTFERKENMNVRRLANGLQRMAQKIFTFGGIDTS